MPWPEGCVAAAYGGIYLTPCMAPTVGSTWQNLVAIQSGLIYTSANFGETWDARTVGVVESWRGVASSESGKVSGARPTR